jgi:hypothetical protein
MLKHEREVKTSLASVKQSQVINVVQPHQYTTSFLVALASP